MTVTPRADWWKRAACQKAEPDLFFPISEKGRSRADIGRARRVCMSCRVRVQCLDYALATQQRHGIWGGTTEDERKRLMRGPPRRRDPSSPDADTDRPSEAARSGEAPQV